MFIDRPGAKQWHFYIYGCCLICFLLSTPLPLLLMILSPQWVWLYAAVAGLLFVTIALGFWIRSNLLSMSDDDVLHNLTEYNINGNARFFVDEMAKIRRFPFMVVGCSCCQITCLLVMVAIGIFTYVSYTSLLNTADYVPA